MGTEAAAIPERVGRYEIVLPIAKGDSSSSLLARGWEGGALDRYVVLKLTTPNVAEDARLLLHLRHTNVVPIYDAGGRDDESFVVMEYVPGDSLAGIRRAAAEHGEELPRAVALRILVDALGGLHAVHELDLAHRGFSAENILVGTDGLSRVDPSPAGDGDRLDDVRSAGILAQEILTGTEADPWLSPEIDDAIAGALCVDREARTQTAQLFARALGSAAKSAGVLADADEVAALVARLAGPLLAERKAALAEARRRRRESTPDVRAMVEGGQSTPMRPQLPSLPDVPVAPLPVPEAPGSELGISVHLGTADADRASEGILGLTTKPLSADDEEEPEVYRSPVVAQTTFGKLLDVARGLVRPPLTKTKKLALAGAGGAVLLIVVVIAMSTSSVEPDAPAEASTAATAAATSAAPAGDPKAPVASPRTTAEPRPIDVSLDHDVPMLHVKANAAIAKVALPDRVIDAVVPALAVAVDLTEADEGRTLKVVVTSTDGRTAIGTAEPGTRELDVTFAGAPPKRAAPKRTKK